MKKVKKKKILVFSIALMIIIAICVLSMLKTYAYNNTSHYMMVSGDTLFTAEKAQEQGEVSVVALARSSTWGKIFDFNNEGISENNYQAYTYDFNIVNHTKDEVKEYTFKMTFSKEAYLSSAWNGALEIHQDVNGRNYAATVPDLREFVAEDYEFETVTVDGEKFITMKPGDYLVYIPSSTMKAMEVPIKPLEGSSPGIIMYIKIGEDIEESTLELSYTFHRLLTDEPLFCLSLTGLGIWFIALIIVVITSAQIKYYTERHERDNKIINESIETFVGFIDAKDSYTNGHSKRVAEYTRLIAGEFGYEGEELDRIYYVALLHDCGKIGVPDNILGKPGRLTDEEFGIIKSHTVRGGEILNSFKSLPGAGEGALYHHERYDGKGYPTGKAGEDIPFIARMICVADSFDAMNTNRVYRKKLTKETIINEIEKNKGHQFDPKVADVMLQLIREDKITVGE